MRLDTVVRPCVNHAAYFPIRVSSRLLAVPRQDVDFESAPLFFCPFGGTSLQGEEAQEERQK